MTEVVEAWLRQRNILVKGFLVSEDEHCEDLQLKTVSLRGAERTVTALLKDQGFVPLGRWETTATYYDQRGQTPTEVMRRFIKRTP